MEKGKMDERFFNSTRGQIVRLLRGKDLTVEDLAVSLNLTDNAVRAHLSTLERDGLVTQAGLRRGARKPHFTYVLTSAAEELFPKSYDALLNVLITVLKTNLPSIQLKKILQQVGRNLADYKMKSTAKGSELSMRIRQAMELLEALGGSPRLEREGDKTIIRSTGCPLASAVESHSEVCSVAEALVAEVTGEHVRERCSNKGSPPHCLFEIKKRKRRIVKNRQKECD